MHEHANIGLLFVEIVLVIIILGIGIYMALKNPYPSPPFLSGVVFILIAFFFILNFIEREN